jgi:hypothetical protein
LLVGTKLPNCCVVSGWSAILLPPLPMIGGLMSEGGPMSGQTKPCAIWVSTKNGSAVRKATPSVTRGTPRVCAANNDDGINIKVPTGKEVSENGRCLEIGNSDGDIGVRKVKGISYGF